MKKAVQKSVDTSFEGTDQEYDANLTIDKILNTNNIVDLLDGDDLIDIGNQVVDGYLLDLETREPWEKDLETYSKLALQVSDKKSYPWVGAANIKFPLLATAAMQFAARAYPTLVPSDTKIVKCRVVGFDPDGQKTQRADRISKHMSYQVLDEMDDWEEDMDKLLLALPLAGTCFKKTYWDSQKQVNASKLVLPKYLVVNYYAHSLEDAERVTEILQLSKRKIKERINKGLYADIKLGDPQEPGTNRLHSVNDAFQRESEQDSTTPYTLLEQHCYLDLDGDDYVEPYIVTVEQVSRKVLRIVPRFTQDDVEQDDKKNVTTINPISYYTKYSFIPNPDGGFYDIGFGRLLGPINESANTIINQLVDAGSLSNLQAGFIGKGLKIKMGNDRFQPGEWKAVNATGDDIKKQVFPLPVREPSEVLFKLLDLLLKSGKELASISEIFVGKMPGQNTPATTTMATIEQGMKVFTAIYKRVYRSLQKEFQKLYRLNRTYLNPAEYNEVIGITVQQNDYEGPEDQVIPGADPTAVSNQEKQQRVQAMMQILQLGTLDPMAITKLYLEAYEIPNAQMYMKQPQPQPDPKVEAMKMKSQLDQQKAYHDIQMDQAHMQMEQQGQQADLAMKAQAAQQDMKLKLVSHILEAQQNQDQHQQTMQHQAQQSKLNMITQAAAAHQKQQLAQEAAKHQAKITPKGKK
jgi:chaperonin GroES